MTCPVCATRPDPTTTGPPGSRFYPSWPQLQFCSYTQIHLGPLRAALLEYGQKCLAASFRLISFSDLSRLIIAASPILTTETTRSSSFMCFPVVLCHHYGCDHGFHYHFKPCLLFSSTPSDNITPPVTAYLGDSVLLSLLGVVGLFGR